MKQSGIGSRVSGIGGDAEGLFEPPVTIVSNESDSKTLTVTALTKAIRDVLETGFADVVVEGEISNFIDHRSGHRYWTLKDADAQISSVFWKTRYVNFDLRDGMKVVC